MRLLIEQENVRPDAVETPNVRTMNSSFYGSCRFFSVVEDDHSGQHSVIGGARF